MIRARVAVAKNTNSAAALMSKVPNSIPNVKDFCRSEIDRMLKNSQTKVIAPVITFGLLKAHAKTGETQFSGF